MIDAFLLALSLWAAYTLRYYSTFWFGLSKSVDPQSNYAWLLVPIMALDRADRTRNDRAEHHR